MTAPLAAQAIIADRFQVVEAVGRGSFGRVFRVIELGSGEPRALKVVPRGSHEGMLLDEFEQLARLRHPSLPKVFEVGRTRAAIDDLAAGAPYFVAEWIDGARSDGTAWSGDLGPRVWALLADLAGALAVIHAAGLVHGDVSPSNVLVEAERAVLVDLGLAATGGARGTPAYMAPEALAGNVEPRSDLYSLGATVIRLVSGRPLFEGATLGELAARILAGAAPRALPGVPAPLADLINRLVARDPDARPASALALLDELDQLAPAIAPGSSRRARPKVGPPPAPATWPGAAEATQAIGRSLGDPAASAIVVVGGTASGARQLAERAARAWQLEQVAHQRPNTVVRGTIDEVGTALGIPAAASARAWLEQLARAARRSVGAVLLDATDDARQVELVAALVRSPGERAVLVIAERVPAPRAGVVVHTAPVLDVEGTRALAHAMLGCSPSAAWATGLHAASGGLPLTAIELVRSIAGERDPFAIDWSTRTTAGATELRAQQLRAMPAGARRAATALAAWGGHARIEHVLTTLRAEAGKTVVGLADIVELERAGLARRHGDTIELGRATLAAVEITAGAPALAHLAAVALAAATRPGDETLEGRGGRHAVLAPLLERATLDAGRAILACDVAEQLLAHGRADRALALARRALVHAPARAGLIAARAASAQGAYDDATAFARDAEAAGADSVQAQLVVARAAQRAGNLDVAEAALARLHALHPDHPEAAGTYARLLVTRSRYADARAIAQAGESPLAALRAEAAGLAAFYLGNLDEADAAFAALELGAQASNDSSNVGRALSLRGMVAQQRGQLGLATDRYREAARRLADAGELHAAATAELNLGTVLAERGRSSEALPRLAAAGRVFAELGASTELCAAELNRGNALLAVGLVDDARVAAEAALARADGAPHLRAFALLVLGDARRRLGDDGGAIRSYREALAIGGERGDAHAQISAYVALAEAGIRERADAEVEALCASVDDRDRWTIARGRLLLHGEANAHAGELAEACGDVAARAADGDRLERAFRGYAVAARLAERARDGARTTTFVERARAAHASWLAAAAPAFRAALETDPDRERLPGHEPDPRTAPARARPGEAPHLRRLLTLSRRLNTEASIERILDDVIDTAIELTLAERGFLLLRQPGGELATMVSRNFSSNDLGTAGTATVSRSIAERAAQTGEPVLTVDAGIDERFGAAASVAALRLRSVLAVPLRQRGSVIGCIYVDHRLRGGAFDDGAASVLGELADIAAIAIENARLTSELRATTRAVDELNARLSAELAERDAELVRVRAELPDRERLRERYERIIGRSPAMLRTLELVDRAAATTLPVVIVGESGTGKELVARALHDHSPRKAGAFVAINCSAVPETLLESELFGHVRGAFTGAERDRRGLFEVADGGTLFLDEIADTGPAMQAKLLRVLQDGMIRRVGDTQIRKVDVRIVAASQLSLADLAAAGRFREDLRFRLEVITIPMPPLREREGDVPLLVEHLLAALCPGRPAPRLTRAALRALSHHRWPGNVRELENALARGVAMGGDVIDVGDLPEAIGAVAARPEPAKPALGEDLRLKPALAATEQAYITAAMTRAKNNQTVAARLLGLSRFGLQKKLRRLAGEDDGDEE
ncbi:MAG: sigma 54-interacting transcriptional regulator [Kofleriaceae bacterium]|nr:sigma 54-interacting transcriptional regulator [Kofleriaceae bacterium]